MESMNAGKRLSDLMRTWSPSVSRRAVFLFLAGTWLYAVGATWWLTAQTSPLVPKFDDWKVMLPALGEPGQITPAWLWSRLHEHRVPLPRLVYLASYNCSGGDFRSAAFVSVLLLGFVALAAMLLARRLRGKSGLEDGFFPLILLHWGQTHVFLIGICVNFTLTIACYYMAIVVVLRPRECWGIGQSVVLTLCLLGMILSSLIGVVLAVPVVAWLGALGLVRLSKSNRREGWACIVLTVILAAVLGLYFVQFTLPGLPPGAHRIEGLALRERASHLTILVAMSLGWLGREQRGLACVGVAGLYLVAMGMLLARWHAHPEDRRRSTALLSLLDGVPLVLAAVTYGRSFITGEELWFTTRYAMLSIPLLVGVYLASLFSFGSRLGWLTRALLFLTALTVFTGHVTGLAKYPHDLQVMRTVRQQENVLVRELLSGRALKEIGRAHV